MSLVNRMLRDLEQQGTGQPGTARVRAVRRRRRARGLFAGLLLAPVILAGLAAGIYWLQSDADRFPAAGEAPEEAPALDLPALDLMEPLIDYQPSSAAQRREPALLERVERVETGAGSRLRLAFDREVTLHQQDGGEDAFLLAVAVEDIEAGDLDLPPVVRDWELETGDEEVQLRLALAEDHVPGPMLQAGEPQARVELVLHEALAEAPQAVAAADPGEDGDSRQPATEPASGEDAPASAADSAGADADGDAESDAGRPAAEATDTTQLGPVVEEAEQILAEAGEMHRQRREPSDAERADRAWSQAREHLSRGEQARAAGQLQRVLEYRPDHIDARRALAELQAERGRPEAADRLLSEGLEHAAEPGPLVRDRARVWLARGEYPRAVAGLEEAWPEIDASVETRAQLAGALYRDGQPARAAEHYQAVVAERSQRAGWWLGLGLAREDLNQPGPAREAYDRALANEGLDRQTRDYIRQRMRALEAEIGEN